MGNYVKCGRQWCVVRPLPPLLLPVAPTLALSVLRAQTCVYQKDMALCLLRVWKERFIWNYCSFSGRFNFASQRTFVNVSGDIFGYLTLRLHVTDVDPVKMSEDSTDFRVLKKNQLPPQEQFYLKHQYVEYKTLTQQNRKVEEKIARAELNGSTELGDVNLELAFLLCSCFTFFVCLFF